MEITSIYYLCVLLVSLPWVACFGRRKKLPPIDGSWSSWESWSPCYKNSPSLPNYYAPWKNFYIQSRNRSCTSPKPLFGGKYCEAPSHRFRQCSCLNPLIGSDAHPIRDTQLSASSNLPGYPPNEARFSDESKGWCAESPLNYFTKTYIQINFQNFTNVGAIATLDNLKGRVNRFKLEYSLNGKSWSYIDNHKVFTGNLLRGKSKQNTFRNHHVMKYLKVLPTQSFGFPCLKIEAFGCVFTCGSLLTAPYGELAARSSVDIDQNCLWRVEVLNTTALTFDFSIFYVLCEYGYVDIRDSDYPFTESPLLHRICLADISSEVPTLNLNRNSVWVNFVSNSSSSEVGFNLKYHSKCSQALTLERGKQIDIKSPNYPNNYFDNLDCKWSITPSIAFEKFEIAFNSFSVESSNHPTKICADDVLVFDIEVDNVVKNYASYCNNNRPPQNLVINADKLFITFKSDLVTTDRGFSISIKSGIKSTPPATNVLLMMSPSGEPSTNGAKQTGPSQHNNSFYREKVTTKKDDTWTVIIICTFSALVVLLIGAVLYMNIKRFINNRDEVNAQCAKVLEEEKKKKKKKTAKSDTNANKERELLISRGPSATPVKDVQEDIPDNPLIISVKLHDGDSKVGVKEDLPNGNVNDDADHPPDQVDGGNVEDTSCDTSVASPKSIVVNCESFDNPDESKNIVIDCESLDKAAESML